MRTVIYQNALDSKDCFCIFHFGLETQYYLFYTWYIKVVLMVVCSFATIVLFASYYEINSKGGKVHV